MIVSVLFSFLRHIRNFYRQIKLLPATISARNSYVITTPCHCRHVEYSAEKYGRAGSNDVLQFIARTRAVQTVISKFTHNDNPTVRNQQY